MTEYVEYFDDVKMAVESGEYKAKIAFVKKPTGFEEYPAPDMCFVWKIMEGDFKDLEVKQNFRLTIGDEEQNKKGKRKFNQAIETLFGKGSTKIPVEHFWGKEAIIKVSDFNGYTFVSSIKSLSDAKTAQRADTPKDTKEFLDDDVVF